MDHVAIMNKSWKLIPKMLSGEKTIESRWYQTKRTPWGRISKGDRVYFKNTAEAVSAKAKVRRVMQFQFKKLSDIASVVKKYGKEICLINDNPATWGKIPKYCILIELEKPVSLKPFHINKKGFGSATAWITVRNINQIKNNGGN